MRAKGREKPRRETNVTPVNPVLSVNSLRGAAGTCPEVKEPKGLYPGPGGAIAV